MKTNVHTIQAGSLTVKQIATMFDLSINAVQGRLQRGCFSNDDFKFRQRKVPTYLIGGKPMTTFEISQKVGISRALVVCRLKIGANKLQHFKIAKSKLIDLGLGDSGIKRNVAGYGKNTTFGDPMWLFFLRSVR